MTNEKRATANKVYDGHAPYAVERRIYEADGKH